MSHGAPASASIVLPQRQQRSPTELAARLRPVLVAWPAAGLVVGLAAAWAGWPDWAATIWAVGTVPVLAALAAEIAIGLQRGNVGLDVTAALAMLAALVLGEHLAAAVVALMYAGGQHLESFAERRASREMTALLARVPRTAMRSRNGTLEEVDLDTVEPGDRLVVRKGEFVPVDGTVAEGIAILDQSALTGESMPVQQPVGDAVMSGATNAGETFHLIAARRAAESTYAGIVRLVDAAQHSRAPMSRLADRYALVFLAATVLLAAGAWLWTGDPIRAVAVLVVATPCPLILAVPVAIIAGVSRAAKHGILIKGGRALEMMSRVRALVIDKTGTLTHGRARIVSNAALSELALDEVLRLGASLDQASKHVIAQAIVEEARNAGLTLAMPSQVVEHAGEGVEGMVEGRRVVVGGPRFVGRRIAATDLSLLRRHRPPGAAAVAVAVDGRFAGLLILADELRAGTEALLQRLRASGVERIVLATGDRQDVAQAVVQGLSIDAVRAELTPDQKILVVLSERKNGPVMMIGDGVNDAPALAAADVGLAMGAKGAAASAEAADVVLLVDQLDRVAPAIDIAQRSRRIALQSVYVGIGLSGAGMIAAASGHLTPLQGAILQEVIDVTVILNALRASYDRTSI
ncbi:MAG: heavy metal translocating P-type ATPase [Hyphomicrobiales bacterium]|nr:heavy metal translocating P-type ATPase [Hyphomicrobiales bacterium]